MYNLFLDDVRTPHTTKGAYYKELGRWEAGFPSLLTWETVKNYNEFVSIIESKGLPKLISFDHDLAWDHYPVGETSMDAKINYEKYEEKTGYHCAKWLIEYCQSKKLPLPDWMVHSFNPVGRKNIIDLLDSYERNRENS
jgi:hypothetical protein